MPRERSLEDVEFAAPTGVRIKVVTWVSFGIVAGFVIYNLALTQHLPARKFWPVALAPLAGLLILVPVWVFARIKAYRLSAEELVVVRVGRVNRFALAGLESVAHDAQAMKGAWKTIGNDGLGAITGSFRSKRLGKFQGLLTDATRAVVLRWPERTLVVSPERPAEFVAAARARTRLRR